MSDYETMKEKLVEMGQVHLLQYYNELDEDAQKKYLEHLNDLDENEMQYLTNKWRKVSSTSKISNVIMSLPESMYESEETTSEPILRKYFLTGLESISKGHVAALVLAGGSGARLGIKYPRGMYSVDLLSGKCLFKIFAERILKLQDIAKNKFGSSKAITWYIMVSSLTESMTKEYFQKEDYLGLDPHNVVFFLQRNTPCFKLGGLLLMEEKNQVAQVPGGSGAVFRALRDEHILEDMEMRGIQNVHCFSVDNILVKVADPIFLGYCIKKKCEAGNKVIRRITAKEELGVVCLINDKVSVIEYSEIMAKIGTVEDSEGTVIFPIANICNHIFTVTFLKKIVRDHLNDLELHILRRHIPHLNEGGMKFTPSLPSCIKLERVISDAFKFSDNVATWEVPRFTDYSVVRYPDCHGTDCPSTARSDLYSLHKRYLENAGAEVHGTEIEISPIVSYAGEGLNFLCRDGRVFNSPIYIGEEYWSLLPRQSKSKQMFSSISLSKNRK